MILRELYELYNRLVKQGIPLPSPGCSEQKVTYRIILHPDGSLVRIEDARQIVEQVKKGKKGDVTVTSKSVPVECLVPGESKPSGSGVNPCFLWDNPAYMLGCTDVKDRAIEYYTAFRDKHLGVEPKVANARFSAVCRFLEQWTPRTFAEAGLAKEQITGNGVFRIVGDEFDVHEDEHILQWWNETGILLWRGAEEKPVGKSRCLITGEEAEIAVTHDPAIKNVRDAQTSGAKLVSFNCPSFESYGKEQSANSPVSKSAAFAYCNALNYLLKSGTGKMNLADATIVFWTDSPEPPENDEDVWLAGAALNPERLNPPAQNAALAARIQDKLESIAKGHAVTDLKNEHTRFFLLGLSPNAARLSVRFYHESTMSEFIHKLQMHYNALRLDSTYPADGKFSVVSPFAIMRAAVRDSKDIPPYFSGALLRAILTGSPYPDSIAMAMLRRLKVNPSLNYVPCAYLKAWLTRKKTSYTIKPMLDPDNTEPGYVLGRLFAALQKTQEDAYKGSLNRTIQDSFYGSASASPQSVFPRIIRMNRHHLAKLDNPGLKVMHEKTIQSIMSLLESFPPRLSLEQQGLFALGFYHQTQSFYTPRKTTSEN